MNQSRQLTDGALLTVIFMILMMIAIFVPVITLITVFLLPVPFIMFASRYDWKPAAIMLIAASILSALLTSILSLPLPIAMGLGGIMVGSAIYHKLSAYETLARGTIGFVVGLVFIFVFSQYVFQVNLVNELNNMFEQSITMSRDVLDQLGMEKLTEEQMTMLIEQFGMLTDLLPVIIAITALLLAFVSQWVSYKVISRLDNKQLQFPPFRMMQLPVSLIWIYFFSLIMTFFGLDQDGMIYLAVNNILMLVGILMALQGFSFIFYYAHVKQMSKALPIGSVVLTIILPFIFLYLVRLLGIIDLGFSLRDRISDDKK
ncbi:membrane protein [Lentibacillus kapialis]|uniref:Membrane protein n=1 Tax=Lentibacillus kapialis TaxID=340214 RepID=A0A917PS60_9BACI|nr:YybS family protein [Lentibacillus kapialis]GGJ89703.1 membrane protein [Lentibacillus kapialis]